MLKTLSLLPGADLAYLVGVHVARAADAPAPDISVPLLYHIAYQEGLPGIDARAVYEVLEVFLQSQGAQRPSELSRDGRTLRLTHLACLLRDVCAPDVLDHSIVYESTDDLERERIDIYEALRALDPERDTFYAREMSRLSTAASIRKTLQTVGGSKVHADVDGIRQSLDAAFQQQFARYSVLQRLDPSLLAELSEPLGKEAVVIISRETTSLFRGMFNDLKARFISSNEHGLDSYLSVRIRHGTLSGHIRSVFERHHLLTRRDSLRGGYHRNEYWMQRLDLYAWAGARIDASFGEFGEAVDSTIDEVRNRWIQVRAESNGNDGLFDYEYSNDDLLVLQVTIGTIQPYAEFVDAMFAELWSRTERNLAVVRGTIVGTLETRLAGHLDRLVAAIQEVAPAPAVMDFRGAVATCKTDLRNTLADISGWFTLGAGITPPDFPLSLALDTSIAIIRRTFSTTPFNPQVQVHDNVMLAGRTLSPFLDALYILLENVIKHAVRDRLEVAVEAFVAQSDLCLKVTNRLAAATDIATLRDHVKELRAHAIEGARRAAIRREGGSGYYKLGKILTHDLKCKDWGVDVLITDERAFVVEIRISLGGVQV